MRVVLGIDAAWTAHNPSGVALAVGEREAWRLLGVWPSYAHFEGAARADETPRGTQPEPGRLLAAAERLAGAPPDLVAFDMPLAFQPITGRRASDLQVSRAFVRMGAATHSPSAQRPGRISDDLRAGFAELGYALAVTSPSGPAIAEVYPHPALIAFMGKRYRLAYKAGKTRQYWPDLGLVARREKLLEVWREIVAALESRIVGVTDALAMPDPQLPLSRWKGFEDQLDAVVCAAIGVEILEGRADPYGDEGSAIWVPRPTAPRA